MWDKVKSLIGNAAPLIGSLLGGRYGEKVGSLIAGALGVEDKPEAIESALRAHPELLLELQKLEHEHRTQLTQLQMAELTEAANSEARRIADIQHAREGTKITPWCPWSPWCFWPSPLIWSGSWLALSFPQKTGIWRCSFSGRSSVSPAPPSISGSEPTPKTASLEKESHEHWPA